MLKKILIASAATAAIALFADATMTPAQGAGIKVETLNIKPKVRPRVRVRPKVRVPVDTRRLVKKKQGGGDEKAERSTIAEGGPQPEPPTAPAQTNAAGRANLDRAPLPRRKPDWIAAMDVGRWDDLHGFNEVARELALLREMETFRQASLFGQEQGAVPGSHDRFTGGLGAHVPEGVKQSGQMQNEGAPDHASLFNQGIPQPGAGNAPSGGGPGRHTGNGRPQPQGAPEGTRPGDVPTNRGWADNGGGSNGSSRVTSTFDHGTGTSTATWRNAGSRDGSGDSHTVRGRNGTTHTLVVFSGYQTTNDEGSSTDVRGTTADGLLVVARSDQDQEGNRYEEVTTYDPSTGAVDIWRRKTASDGTVLSEYHDHQENDSVTVEVDHPEHADGLTAPSPSSTPDSQPNPADGRGTNQDQAYLCATTPWVCQRGRHGGASPEEMLSQPDDPGNEGGSRGRGTVARLGQDAVTNTGDSTFSTTPGNGLSPGEAYGGRGVGDPLDGECPTCTAD